MTLDETTSSSTDDDGPTTTTTQPQADPESLARVTSGPAYSVFSKSTKRWIVTMIAFSSFVSPMTANIYFPALVPISEDLGVSVGLINLTLTTYMIFQAIAPTLVGDLGDMAGRRPAFIIAFIIYIIANLGLALQDNYAALLVLRAVQSAGSSGTLALSFAAIADVAVSAERGKYMGIISAAVNVGPALSPVVGGLLSEYFGWRAVFWFCLAYAGAWLVPYILAVPETCRNVVGNGSIPARGWNRTVVDLLRARRHQQEQHQHQQQQQQPSSEDIELPPKKKLRLPNPFNTLRVIIEKDLSLLLFYNTMIYLVFILITATVSTEFSDIYSLTNLQLGLCYLPYGLGCCIAAVIQGYVLDANYRRVARKIGFTIDYKRGDDLSKFPIEKARIVPVLPFLFAGAAGVIAYGWVLEAETHLVGPLVLLFVIGLCVTGSFSLLNTLVVDLYPQAPATAVAAVNLVRCLFGAGGTAVIELMLKAMGRGWCFTFWALVLVAFSPILWVLTKWGPGWREERKARELARSVDKEKEEAST